MTKPKLSYLFQLPSPAEGIIFNELEFEKIQLVAV